MTRLILLAPLAFVAACSSEPEDRAGGEDLEAKGEILGGTISDDMLPLESVTSQSPPLAGEEERLRQLETGSSEPAPDEPPADLASDDQEIAPTPPSATSDEADPPS